MDDINQKIIERFEYLAQQGKSIHHKFSTGVYPEEYMGVESRTEWLNKVVTLLETAMGKDSRYVQTLEGILTPKNAVLYEHNIRSTIIKTVIGTIDAAADQYKNGYMFNLHRRLQVDIFGDLLEQARQYLESDEEEHRGIATIIAGCVLEDSMRKLCERHEIKLQKNPTMARMITPLSKKMNFSKVQCSQLMAYIKLRDAAAHINWDECSASQVKSMVDFVNEFLAKHFDS